MRISRLLTIGAAATAGTLVLTGVALAAFDVFNDVPQNYWARDYIEWANDNHVMTGPGGQERVFQPNKPVTRAELAAVSFRLFMRMQADIDMLSRRVMELEQRAGIGYGSSSSSSSSSSGMSMSSSSSSYSSPGSSQSLYPARTNRIILTATLLGSSQVPTVDTNGRGTARFQWTNQGLWYDMTVNNLSTPITGAHFHLGSRGQNGPILKPITFVENRAQGYWSDITSEQWLELTMGRVYVNVHTTKYPDGEIRGQLNFQR